MAENSSISWTDHTFNPWIGCTKVSDACRNCYAEADWLITGGESGPGFRPLDMDAVRSLRDQCKRNGISFHHKQNGGIRGKEFGCLVDGIEHKSFPPALAA